MEWNGLFGLIYGLLGGLFEFLPVSPQVHQQVLIKVAGLDAPVAVSPRTPGSVSETSSSTNVGGSTAKTLPL